MGSYMLDHIGCHWLWAALSSAADWLQCRLAQPPNLGMGLAVDGRAAPVVGVLEIHRLGYLRTLCVSVHRYDRRDAREGWLEDVPA